MVTALFYSAPRIFYFLLPPPSFLPRKIFPARVNRERRRAAADIRVSSLKLFPGNIAKRTAPVYVPISAGRKTALCRSWIDFAVICATTDYSLPFPFHFLDFISASHSARSRSNVRYDLIPNRNPDVSATRTNFSQ